MAYVEGVERTQATLFPQSLDEYIMVENPVRLVDAFVEGLDLEALGFERAVPAETGRPGYSPGDLLRLYIYGGTCTTCGRAGCWNGSVNATWR
jgi:transposase